MLIAVPVVLSIVAALDAFEVLAAIYAPEGTTLLALICGAGGLFGIVFNSFAIGDSPGLHPTTMTAVEFDSWRDRQWIRDRAMAYRMFNIVAGFSCVPLLVGIGLRLAGVRLPLNQTSVNWLIGTGVGLALAGTFLSATRTRHPELGNEQKALRRFEAWSTNLTISLYTLALMIMLP